MRQLWLRTRACSGCRQEEGRWRGGPSSSEFGCLLLPRRTRPLGGGTRGSAARGPMTHGRHATTAAQPPKKIERARCQARALRGGAPHTATLINPAHMPSQAQAVATPPGPGRTPTPQTTPAHRVPHPPLTGRPGADQAARARGQGQRLRLQCQRQEHRLAPRPVMIVRGGGGRSTPVLMPPRPLSCPWAGPLAQPICAA